MELICDFQMKVASMNKSRELIIVACRSIGDNIFFDMEADFGFGRRWRCLKKGAEFLVDVAQRAVVQEQGFVNFGKAFGDGGVGGKVLAHFYEGTDDIEAHLHPPEDCSNTVAAMSAPRSVKANGRYLR